MPEDKDDAVNRYFEYDGLPAYRDAGGFMVVTRGGKERPVDDLDKFVHGAVPISKEAFDQLRESLAG